MKYCGVVKLNYSPMKTLVCINTCNRSDQLMGYVFDFIKYCRNKKDYDFIVSLDGKDEDTINFCEKYKIPLIYSEKREGVGISKNRVLEKFNDYDYYFFLEDDVELLNGEIFEKHIDVANRCGFYHISLDERWRFIGNEDTKECGREKINYYDYGSASFNFFTKEGIEIVGGFHEEFAKYKRFGHTEHTYRYVNVKLHDRAFMVLENCFEGYCNWHNPPSVTDPKQFKLTKNRLATIEQDVIDKKLSNFPIKTLSKYYFNEYCVEDVRMDFLENISQCQKEVQKIKESKPMLLENLCSRSIKSPYKFITFPYNAVKILLKK